MAYIDWGATNGEVRAELERQCQQLRCLHPRYRHGKTQTTWYGYGRIVEYQSGPCEVCGCTDFALKPPITSDDVLDAVERLRAVRRLADLGVGV